MDTSTGAPGDDEELVRSPRVFVRRTAAALVVLGTAEAPEVLSGTAVTAWEAFARPRRLAAVASELAAAYGADAELVLADLRPVVERLVHAGVLTAAHP